MKMKRLYKSIVALAALWLTGAATAQAGDVTTLYERGYETAWASTDVAEGEWEGTGSISDNSLSVYKKKGTATLTKTIDPTANVTLTVDAEFKFDGMASASTHTYIKLFDNFVLDLTNKGANMNFILNGNTIKTKTGYAKATTTALHLEVNTATNAITALTLTQSDADIITLDDINEEKRSFTAGTEYSSLVLQVSASSYDGYVYLQKIKVQQETQSVATYGYTVNYKDGEDVVKTVEGSLAEGAPIPVLTALDGEGFFEGNHYLIAADVAPVQTVTTTPTNNVLNVDVRAPYSTTLNVYRVLDGVKEDAPFITKNLTETDDKVADWVYTFPLCVQIDEAWYEATLKDGKFGEQGTFTNDAIEKTVDYTSNANIVGFWDQSHTNTVDNLNYSGGSMDTYWKETAIGSLEAGTYEMTAMQTESYSSELYGGWVSADEKGTLLASFGKDNRTKVFTLATDEESVQLYRGSNGRMDYILLKKNPSVTVTIGSTGFATYSNAQYALDFTNVEGLKAYAVTVDGEQLQTAEVTAAVPASTGLLLKGAADTYNVPAVATAEALADNDLLPTTGSTLSEAGYVFYGLTENDGKVCFGLIGDFPPSVGKAYLKVADTGEARAFYHFAETDVTGINEIGNRQSSNRQMYDLQGRRLMKAARGLYIIDGKKYSVK